MDKKSLSERDICTKFITPALRKAGWDEMAQIRAAPNTSCRVCADGRAPHRREPSATCRRRSAAGQPGCPRRVWAAAVRPDTLRPADGGAVALVAGVLTVLPLLSLLHTDCRRAATPAPDSRYSTLLTDDRPRGRRRRSSRRWPTSPAARRRTPRPSSIGDFWLKASLSTPPAVESSC